MVVVSVAAVGRDGCVIGVVVACCCYSCIVGAAGAVVVVALVFAAIVLFVPAGGVVAVADGVGDPAPLGGDFNSDPSVVKLGGLGGLGTLLKFSLLIST